LATNEGLNDELVTSSEPSIAGDEGVLRRFGYRPELRRTLRPWAVFGVAFSFMSITTSLYTTYGYGVGQFGTASIWLWPVVLIGQLLVALIIAELGSRIPLAGYSYQWGARLIGAGFGWIIALVAFAYLLTSAATITYVLVAPFIATILGTTFTATQSLLVALCAVAVLAVINVVGVRLFARINNVAVVAEIVSSVVIALAIVVAIFAKGGHPHSLVDTNGVHGPAVFGGMVGALAMGLFALTGFESAADMSEEAVGATGSVPRAVIGSLVGSGLVGMLGLICFGLATTDLAATAASGTPVADIMTHWFGAAATRGLLVFPLVAVLGTALAVIAIEGRLLFALARDHIAPGSALLRKVNGSTKTPAAAIAVGAVLTGGMLVYANYQSHAFSILVGSTSILPFVVYLMLIGAYALRRRQLASLHAPGTFTLGRWAVPVFSLAFVWIICALLALTVPKSFHQADVVVAGVLVVAVLWYLTALRARLRSGSAGVARLEVEPAAAAAAPATDPAG
jgi:amino acid transporter